VSGVFADVGTLTVTIVDSEAGTGITVVDYEFSGPDGPYDISAEVDFADGEGFLPIDNAHIDGNLTNVEPGVHSLTWNGGISFPDRYHENTILELTATQVCGENASVTFTYNGEEVTYGTVWRNGLCWMDRHLGALNVPDNKDDYKGYGDLFQWGRGDDGHQVVTWTGSTTGDFTTTTTVLSDQDEPGHSDFITNNTSQGDWREPQNNNLWQGVDGINNPCPPGWRVPTEAELDAELENWDPKDDEGAFASDLKWPVGGSRRFSDGDLHGAGNSGRIWSSTVAGGWAYYLYFASHNTRTTHGPRANGMSVRCVRDIVRTEDE